MKKFDKCHFVYSDFLKKEADVLFLSQKKILKQKLENFDIKIEHVGALSIPHCLTKGDMDIQIRVYEKDFSSVCKIMKTLFSEKHKKIWTKNRVIFEDFINEFAIDYLLTVIGSEEDFYYFKGKNILIENSDLLNEYNSLKKEFEDLPYLEYRKAKTIFWEKILMNHLGFKKIL